MALLSDLVGVLGWDSDGRMLARCDAHSMQDMLSQLASETPPSDTQPVLVIAEPDLLNSTFVNDQGEVVFTRGPHVPLIISSPKRVHVLSASTTAVAVMDPVYTQPIGYLAPIQELGSLRQSDLVYLEDFDAAGCRTFFRAQICLQFYLLPTTTSVSAASRILYALCCKNKAGQFIALNLATCKDALGLPPPLPKRKAIMAIAAPDTDDLDSSKSPLTWEEVHQLLCNDDGGDGGALFFEPPTTLELSMDTFDDVIFDLF